MTDMEAVKARYKDAHVSYQTVMDYSFWAVMNGHEMLGCHPIEAEGAWENARALIYLVRSGDGDL